MGSLGDEPLEAPGLGTGQQTAPGPPNPRRACPLPSASASTGRALGPRPRPDSRAEPAGQTEGCPQDARYTPRSRPTGEPISLPSSTDPCRAAPTPAPAAWPSLGVSQNPDVPGQLNEVGLLPLLCQPVPLHGQHGLSPCRLSTGRSGGASWSSLSRESRSWTFCVP